MGLLKLDGNCPNCTKLTGGPRISRIVGWGRWVTLTGAGCKGNWPAEKC
jgi:hypothetical protein